jgi:hypothetical protein
MHFLGYNQSYLPILERIAVYHDLGLWDETTTRGLGKPGVVLHESVGMYNDLDRSIGLDKSNYILRSLQIAEAHLGHVISPANMATLRGAIAYHHKLLWQPAGTAFDEAVINAFRRADWLDTWHGTVRSGMPWSLVLQVAKSIPRGGGSKSCACSFGHYCKLFSNGNHDIATQSLRHRIQSSWRTFRDIFI